MVDKKSFVNIFVHYKWEQKNLHKPAGLQKLLFQKLSPNWKFLQNSPKFLRAKFRKSVPQFCTNRHTITVYKKDSWESEKNC